MFFPHDLSNFAHDVMEALGKGFHHGVNTLSYPIHEIPQIEVSAEQSLESTELALEETGDSGKEISEEVKNQRKNVQAHKNHMLALKGLFGNYGRTLLRNTLVMTPPVAFCMTEPEVVSSFINNYRLAFIGLAIHMALKAEQASHHDHHRHHLTHKLGEAPNPDEVLGEDVIHPPQSEKVGILSHYSMALETTVAVLFLIHDLPLTEKLLTSGFIMGGMPSLVLAFSTGLILLEDAGQRLQNWKPKHTLGLLLTKNNKVDRIGLALESTASPSFERLQILGKCLLSIGIGRVFYRALPRQESFVENTAQNMADYSPFPHGLSAWAIRLAFWGATGFILGERTRKTFNFLKKSPNFLKKSPIVISWMQSARALTPPVN
jgi:hypothetical protein